MVFALRQSRKVILFAGVEKGLVLHMRLLRTEHTVIRKPHLQYTLLVVKNLTVNRNFVFP
jgi:hypothetical protein